MNKELYLYTTNTPVVYIIVSSLSDSSVDCGCGRCNQSVKQFALVYKHYFTHCMLSDGQDMAEQKRLKEDTSREKNWKRWGPYLSERQWGTVREDYSPDGAWFV